MSSITQTNKTNNNKTDKNKTNKSKFNYNQTYSFMIQCSDLNKTPILIKQVNPSHYLTQKYWDNLSVQKQSHWLIKQINTPKAIPKSNK